MNDSHSTSTDTTTEHSTETLERGARIDVLEAENARLRAEYARLRRTRYRRTAYGLGIVGVFALTLGLVLPESRAVLVTLGFTGLFGALLTFYLTPTRVIAGDVSERVYATAARNYQAIRSQLGLTDEYVYLPTTTDAVKVYVPGDQEYDLPDPDAGPFVVGDNERGLLLDASGASLFEEFERAVTGEVATEPTALLAQLTDALVEQFELVDAVDADVDSADSRATVRLSGSAFGDVDRFDNPVASFLAAGVATGLDTPVILDVTAADGRADWLVTLRWE